MTLPIVSLSDGRKHTWDVRMRQDFEKSGSSSTHLRRNLFAVDHPRSVLRSDWYQAASVSPLHTSEKPGDRKAPRMVRSRLSAALDCTLDGVRALLAAIRSSTVRRRSQALLGVIERVKQVTVTLARPSATRGGAAW